MCKATGDQHKRLTQIMTLTQTRMVINKFIFAIGVLWALGGCSQLPIGGADTAPGGAGDTRAVATAPARDALAAVPKRPARLGLALGGGAARGFAHVGVIQVLEREGIRPDLLAGTSAGSLVAVLYASGLSGAELERVALGMEEATLTDWSLPLGGRGFLRGEALARYVRQAVDGKSLEQMALPLGVLATDLRTGEGVLFRRGDAATAVRASSAVPGVFTPVAIAGRDYVDGGLVAPVPVQQVRDMGADVVLAIDISNPPEANNPDGNLEVLLQTFAIMGRSINRHELARAQVVVRPALAGVGSANFAARQQAIAAGRAAMTAALPALRAAMAQAQAPR